MPGSERIFRGVKAFVQGFFVGVPICLTVTDNFCTVCQVEGVSMRPVLNPDFQSKDFVLINRWKAKQFDKIQRGDVVSIVSPKDPTTLFIKRIIALEGDKIRTLGYKNRIVRIPSGHCWIEGDNRKHSLDSNSFGSVPLGLVNGVATRVIWPPSRWTKLTSELPCGRHPFDIIGEHAEQDGVIEQDGVKSDVRSDAINESDTRNDVNSDVKETLRSRTDVESNVLRSKFEHPELSNVLTNLPENVRRHASDMAS